jgi:hypothetical protein
MTGCWVPAECTRVSRHDTGYAGIIDFKNNKQALEDGMVVVTAEYFTKRVLQLKAGLLQHKQF